MNSESSIRAGRKLFLASFLIGTAIFLAYILMNNESLLLLGYSFLAFAALLNVGLLTLILVNAGVDQVNRKELLKTGGLMLLNIPIAFLYMTITASLMNMMVITFVNCKDKEISNIHIAGYEDHRLDLLAPKEKQTVWIDLKGDCQIDISYDLDGERKVENVVGYACRGLGERTTYEIGKPLAN